MNKISNNNCEMFKFALVAKLAAKLGLSQAKSFAAAYILDFLTDVNPTSTAVSYSIQVYTHKNYTSGFIGPIITRVWKYSYKYYATANLTGPYTEDYEFKCQM
ncbi:hypothetical protein L0M92_08030 [Casaltella massiliensis]|nr:hypothetical protein [Casaltella massiliensis]